MANGLDGIIVVGCLRWGPGMRQFDRGLDDGGQADGGSSHTSRPTLSKIFSTVSFRSQAWLLTGLPSAAPPKRAIVRTLKTAKQGRFYWLFRISGVFPPCKDGFADC
jgi:hypothetical protein